MHQLRQLERKSGEQVEPMILVNTINTLKIPDFSKGKEYRIQMNKSNSIVEHDGEKLNPKP